MGYDVFLLGSLTMNGEPQKIPENPTYVGDIPQYDRLSKISLGEAVQEKTITWVKPKGLSVLAADRVLLSNISWAELAKNGFVDGIKVLLKGQCFRCRLPRVGMAKDEANEWDDIINMSGGANALLHWSHMYFWGAEKVPSEISSNQDCGVIRGWTANGWNHMLKKMVDKRIGFRPAPDPIGFYKFVPNCSLDGQDFQFGALPGNRHFCPILQPAQSNIFAGALNGQKVHMYALLKDGKPVRTDTNRKGKFQDIAQLEITDRYYGDEFLIPWTISNGVAIADKSLLIQTDS